jgi:hypothetical protein
MARKTNRKRYLILGADVKRITGLKWSTICWHVWHSRFVWDETGKVKIRKNKNALAPVKGRRYSAKAVWDVNAFLQYNPTVFRKLGTQNAWTRLHFDLNDFED